MAFFKLGKKKKEDSLEMPMPSDEMQAPTLGLPIEQVTMMKQHGYTDNQVIQGLQSQGFNTSEIYDAINQAGLSGANNRIESAEQPEIQPEPGMPEYGQSYAPEEQFQTSQQMPMEIQTPMPIDENRIHEVAEAIIDEKWKELTIDIKKVIEWKERSEDRIAKVEQQILDLRMSIDTLTKSIMARVSSYDQNIVEVGTEIKAMEKVFQKVLPTLTENVNKLDRMTKGFKEPQQEKKK